MKKKYPLISSKKQIEEGIRQAREKLRNNLTKKELLQLKKIQDDFRKGKDTLHKYSKNGKLFVTRVKFHKKIIKKHFKDKSTIDKKDPDLYILGGVAGSGKTEVLAKKYIPEKTIVIDNDKFKEDLAKKDKSPLKKYVLSHAAKLHNEASLLFDKAKKKAREEKRDTTLDMTFASYDKGKKIIKNFKKSGYDIHLLGTQKYVHQTIPNIVARFLKKGRYVPPEVPALKGNQINKNVLKARKLTNTHRIMDTSIKGKPIIVSVSKKPINVKRHKRKNLKHKPCVRKHRRRKPRKN